MDDPGCIGGKLISFNPVRGPDDSKRKSLQILDSLIESLFTAEE